MAQWGDSADDPRRGHRHFNGAEHRTIVMELCGHELTPDEVNDAVELLEREGDVDVVRTIGTDQYGFEEVGLTSLWRFLGVDEVVLVITPVFLREIDYRKDRSRGITLGFERMEKRVDSGFVLLDDTRRGYWDAPRTLSSHGA